ncbi:unnamed protein product [Penicillium camemberti]|uniref:Str. FM013 n=1 Tax=Penicillium camemberti (strain FM 013) TaxID=1429867 RepID=A0A0G4P3G6_PENC3|nr:unnamed protein product [Penicillium camemberti]
MFALRLLLPYHLQASTHFSLTTPLPQSKAELDLPDLNDLNMIILVIY